MLLSTDAEAVRAAVLGVIYTGRRSARAPCSAAWFKDSEGNIMCIDDFPVG